jgi:hypothetical protein
MREGCCAGEKKEEPRRGGKEELRRGEDVAPGEEEEPRRGEDVALLEVRRGGGAGSTATSPRPAAAPHHEVRGERKGEVGNGAAVCSAVGDGGGGGRSAGERG